MTIKFRTKKESNREQELAFLALTPHERLLRFFELVRQVNRFKTLNREEKKNNFVIVINRE
ncbi:MAG TPA: hypothetical protein VKZ44_04590 [Taishania sp.]|nr:hypothetical protein [Taishania sp.]